MNRILHENIQNLEGEQRQEHPGYGYTVRNFLPRSFGGQCKVSVYEIKPGMSAYPYHFHLKNEEFFYIISGTGVLRTPEGERNVMPGDLLFFPANEAGAHKLTNTSDTEPLVYLDVDTQNNVDVTFYPDSEKMGVWGKMNQVYEIKEPVAYFKGE